MCEQKYKNSKLHRPQSPNFLDGLTTMNWGEPIYARAVEQHEAYCEALRRCGLALVSLEADDRYPDSTFVEDTAVRAPPCAILARPGGPRPAGEEGGAPPVAPAVFF